MVSKERWARALRVHGSAASTGACSRLHPLPGAAFPRELQIVAMLRGCVLPRMIGTLLAAPSRRRCGRRHWRPPSRRGDDGFEGRRGDFGPADRAIAVPDVDVAGHVLTDLDRAACRRSEEHTSELQSPYQISYAVFCLKKIFF